MASFLDIWTATFPPNQSEARVLTDPTKYNTLSTTHLSPVNKISYN